MLDITLRLLIAVPKLLADTALALNAVDNVVIALTIPIATNPFNVDSTKPKLFANETTALPASNIPLVVLPFNID